ncbi:peptidase [Haloechinothrix salitolerans]|uniref:Trypsin-like serine peptidase n=1 Tax=Haloechinothrix salitolerans TaxID=926830 RepID=A0ABW2C4K2_9PSEU
MKRLIARMSTMLAGVALASAALTPQAAALSASAPAPNLAADIASRLVPQTVSADATDYWTPERMRDAVELDKIELSRLPDLGDVRVGEPMSVAPSPAADLLRLPRLLPGLGGGGSDADESTGSPWTDGGDVVATAGRVFFTIDGRDASCSGNAVTSENKSTVITAGHCVKYQGSWHSDWVFVPAYHDGKAPYGEWPAASTHTTPQWDASEDINYDIGAAVVRSVGGQRLTDVVGGQGIAFNQPRGQRAYAFGYPAADPYDGSRLIYCAGTTFDDFLFSNDLGLNCDMTGGSSGGPWFVGFDPLRGIGMQNSVNSFGYVFLPDVMFGPYFGDTARQLYEDVQNR